MLSQTSLTIWLEAMHVQALMAYPGFNPTGGCRGRHDTRPEIDFDPENDPPSPTIWKLTSTIVPEQTISLLSG